MHDSMLGGGEDAALAAITRQLSATLGLPPAGEIWIGDDAAVVEWSHGPLVLAVDAAVAGIHAELELVSLADLGWKAVAAAISDIAAMGAQPRHGLVTLCLPAGTDLDQLNGGVAEAAAEWACPIVGGDLTGGNQVVVSIAVTGSLEPPDQRATTRGGASPGDRLFLTGPVGASAAGLRVLRDGPPSSSVMALVDAHRRPRARVAEGRAARAAGATAMIDVSDGLARDLHRMAIASRVGIDLDALPVASGATPDEALGGGEDYELVIAVPPQQAEPMVQQFVAAGLRPPVAIGQCTQRIGQLDLDGQPIPPVGWQHDLG
jgi:thiamine-monophosphate kinase